MPCLVNSTQIITTFSTPAGDLNVVYDEHAIYRATFDTTPTTPVVPQSTASDNHMTKCILNELHAFQENPKHRFKLPIQPTGTPYQLKVWAALLNIPPGYPKTYGELAAQLNSAPRAIGQACKRNPIALFIPCHRIVGQHHIGGYMGRTDLPYKNALLQHEQKNT